MADRHEPTYNDAELADSVEELAFWRLLPVEVPSEYAEPTPLLLAAALAGLERWCAHGAE